MPKKSPGDTNQQALFELETVPVSPRPRRARNKDEMIFVGWHPDITEFVEGSLPQGLLASKLSIELKGFASMLCIYADETGCINPAPSYVQLAGMYPNGHPADVVKHLNAMIVTGWLFYVGPQHFQWGMGDPPEFPFLIPPSAVEESVVHVEPRKMISRAELENRSRS
jgi:hypothetical protein